MVQSYDAHVARVILVLCLYDTFEQPGDVSSGNIKSGSCTIFGPKEFYTCLTEVNMHA